MNLIKSASSKLQNTFKFNSIFSNLKCFESTTSDTDKTKTLVYNSEELPPPKPYIPWPGDDNVKALEYINKLPEKFKYGAAPRFRHIPVEGTPVIRLRRANKCPNRRFYRIVLMNRDLDNTENYREDIGSYDPMPNKDNQIIVAINFQRVRELMGSRVPIKQSVAELLGLSGFLPVHPKSYLRAYQNKKRLEESNNQQKTEENTSEN